jgi:hypothetical protein
VDYRRDSTSPLLREDGNLFPALTAHELVAIAPTLSEMEAHAFFDYPSKAIAVFDPSLADRFDTDIHDIRLSVSFAAALEGRYAPVASAAWPAFRQQDYTARTLREALPRVLRAATKHLDDLEFYCTSRLARAQNPEQREHLEGELRDVARMRADFVARIHF